MLAACALALCACSKPESPPPPTEAPAPPPAVVPSSASTVPSPASSPAAQGLPTEEDFEEESASTITPENLDAQLDALEREIEAE
jgi:hypothetical protein